MWTLDLQVKFEPRFGCKDYLKKNKIFKNKKLLRNRSKNENSLEGMVVLGCPGA